MTPEQRAYLASRITRLVSEYLHGDQGVELSIAQLVGQRAGVHAAMTAEQVLKELQQPKLLKEREPSVRKSSY